MRALLNSSAQSVLLARHGETEWNLLGRRQGHLDSPLTAKGYEDADQIAAIAAEEGATAIFTSPLGRASETSFRIGEQIGIRVQTVIALSEMDMGDMAGLTDDQIEQQMPGELARRELHKYRWRFPAGESYADVDTRAQEALHEIALTPTLRPLIISHEMIGRMLLRHLADLAPSVALGRSLLHGTVTRIENGTVRVLP